MANGNGSKVSSANTKQTTKGKKGFQPGNKHGYRFKPGYDPKRNYHGRPKDHDELRDLIRDVLSEEGSASGGEKRSRLYDLIVRMTESQNPTDHTNVIEHGFGKVPQAIEISKMTDDDLRKFIAQQLGIAGSGIGGGEQARPLPQVENGEAPKSG